jgi:benzylsuccinate CoA-transferase BbsF subunit
VTPKPLAGIRIVDFCWVGAGSYATKLLADLGADVIKIESEARIDGIRLSAPFAGGEPGVNASGYFADRNTSKRSCTINMKTQRGQEIARALVKECDVVANSFTPGVMERFGLSWEEVHRLNPAAVYLAMSMQGDGGPERHYMGYGLTISALVGLHALSGIPGELPVGTGTNYPDHIPNPCHAAFAVLAALRHVRKTGRGQYIDLAQTEATISVLGTSMLQEAIQGNNPEPIGNGHDRYAPHGVYACAGVDRWIAIAVKTDDQFQRLVKTLEIDPAVVDGLEDEAARRKATALLDRAISDRTTVYEPTALAETLQAAGVPAAPVHDSRGVVELDPQLASRGHWLRLDHDEMGETLYNAPPFRFSRTDDSITVPAPLLGEHTVEICMDILGMSLFEVESLQADGVLA